MAHVLTRRKVQGNYKTFPIKIQPLLVCSSGGDKQCRASNEENG